MADFEETVLINVKEDLGISDVLQDKVLKRLISKVCDHFKLAYGTEIIDNKFSFIIEDCTIKRFNRRGAEGASSETIEGHSVTYDDVKYEFLPYDDLLQKEFSTGRTKNGRVFIL
ncbi:MAG: phage head-tail connector protein [Streptococcus sp.]|nr:phage head-tail connector protein [Streptococcus sp.]